MTTLARHAARGALWTISGSMASRAVGLVGTVLVTRFVAPVEYGEVTVAAVVVLTANQCSTLGFGQYLVARADAPRSVAFHATAFHLVVGVLAAAAVLGVGGRFGVALDAPGMAAFLPGLVVSGLIDRLSYVPERILVRDLRFRAVSGGRALGDVAYSVACVGLAAMGWGGMAIVAGNVARSLARTAVFLRAVELRDWFEPSRPSLDVTRRLFAFGVPMWLGSLCAFASRRWDNLLVSRFFGPATTGVYNLAYNLADVPAIQVGEQIGDVLLPSFARLERSRRGAALARSLGMLALVVFPLAIGLGAVAPTLVDAVFDARWRPIGPMLVLLSALSVTRPVGWTVESYLQACERPRWILGLEAFKVVALVALIATLGRVSPMWTCGAVGVAFAAHALLCLWMVQRVEGPSLARSLGALWPALAASAPMVLAVLGARHLLAAGGVGAPWGRLFLEVLAGALGYVLGALLVAPSRVNELVTRVLDAVRSRD
jgi:PST family polysaccharide transporter